MGLYLLTMLDSSVAIMQTVDPATPQESIAKWPPNEQSQVSWIQEINKESIPPDRTFRNAWTNRNLEPRSGSIDVDMSKARNICRDGIRKARSLLFADLDVEYIKAEESGDVDKQLNIISRRQSLRDLPQDPRIEEASTPEELKLIEFDELRRAE